MKVIGTHKVEGLAAPDTTCKKIDHGGANATLGHGRGHQLREQIVGDERRASQECRFLRQPIFQSQRVNFNASDSGIV